jgi:hypothetical protein
VRYGFPVRAMLLTTGVAYFFSGFWKLASVGPAWIWSDNLANLAARLAWSGFAGRFWIFERYAWLGPLAAFGTVAFELGFLAMVLVSLPTRILAIAAAFAFHLGTYLLIDISFGSLLLCYLAQIDVAALLVRAGLVPPAVVETADRGLRPASRAAGLLVVGGVALLGAARIGDGWPLAGYPRFDTRYTREFTSYVLVGTTGDGRTIRVHDAQLGVPPLSRHFFNVLRANQNRVPAFEEVDGREARFRAGCTFVWQRHPALREAREVRFVFEDVWLGARRSEARVVRDRVLFECSPPDGTATP